MVYRSIQPWLAFDLLSAYSCLQIRPIPLQLPLQKVKLHLNPVQAAMQRQGEGFNT